MKFDVLNVDKATFTVRLKDYMEAHMKRGAKEFARVAISRIPVRTGFVAGAMGALADLAGYTYQIRPQAFFKKKRSFASGRGRNVRRFDQRRGFAKKEYYYPPGGGQRILKTPLSGRRYATKRDSIIKFAKHVATFEFKVDITYFNISDIQASRSPTSPWRSFELGFAAMQKYLAEKTGTKEFPTLDKFIKKTTLGS